MSDLKQLCIDLEHFETPEWAAGETVPQKRNQPKLEKIMEYLKKAEKRAQKHPSYGYATPEEIEELQTIGVCPRYYKILKDIEKRTKAKGKKK